MTPKTCDVCGKVFSTKFCPECGKAYKDIKVEIPISITTYLHGDEEDNFETLNKYNIDPDSELGKNILYCGYEVKFIWEIKGDDLILKQIDAGDSQGICNVIPIKKNTEEDKPRYN